MSPAEGAVEVAALPHRSLAEMTVDRLRQEGIRAWFEADDAGGAYPALAFDTPVKVYVEAADEAWARNVLDLGPGPE